MHTKYIMHIFTYSLRKKKSFWDSAYCICSNICSLEYMILIVASLSSQYHHHTDKFYVWLVLGSTCLFLLWDCESSAWGVWIMLDQFLEYTFPWKNLMHIQGKVKVGYIAFVFLAFIEPSRTKSDVFFSNGFSLSFLWNVFYGNLYLEMIWSLHIHFSALHRIFSSLFHIPLIVSQTMCLQTTHLVYFQWLCVHWPSHLFDTFLLLHLFQPSLHLSLTPPPPPNDDLPHPVYDLSPPPPLPPTSLQPHRQPRRLT